VRDFDSRLDSLQRESIDLQAQLMAAARRLDLAADDADAEQRSRVLAREDIQARRQAALNGAPYP
jgi:uncharacterized protein (DUF3084 family)